MSSFPRARLEPREQIIATCRQLGALGLNQGTSGNVSVRLGESPADGFLLTPTSLDSAALPRLRLPAGGKIALTEGRRGIRRGLSDLCVLLSGLFGPDDIVAGCACSDSAGQRMNFSSAELCALL